MNELAPYAAQSAHTLGRRHQEQDPAGRSQFQRDRDRVIHSKAFRRLEYKTQVFLNHEGDLYRTRLTHSLEVAQIARSVARQLQLNEDLTEAIALAHDLGHTPFGHAGQDALNECMKPYGGFEHNVQSLRVVDELEERYAEFPGLNLCFETREGILKHCPPETAQHLGEVARRFIHGGHPSIEAQITNLADEIAYNNHDIDDGLRSGLLTLDDLRAAPVFYDRYEEMHARYPQAAHDIQYHEAIRRLINDCVTDLVQETQTRLNNARVRTIDDVYRQRLPMAAYSRHMAPQVHQLKWTLKSKLYRHRQVLNKMEQAKAAIHGLFHMFMQDMDTMPPKYGERLHSLTGSANEAKRARIIADYIAGMTDRFALNLYQERFGPLPSFMGL